MTRLPPGAVLGRYEIVAHIGSGGMGDVYRARDRTLDKTVALKTIAAAYAQDPTSHPRFERERRLTGALEHPRICRLLDAGREEGVDYIAMEYLDGESLAARLSRGPLPVDVAVGYAIEIADALEYAHARGVIHRDLKPANVFLTATGAKVLDFGLAKLRQAGNEPAGAAPETAPIDATAAGAVIGSAPYMAPERLEGRDADARSDVFAFGLLLYEMLTGTRAFDAASPAAMIAAILAAEPPPMRLQHPKAADLEWIVARCLAKHPDGRWQAIGDVKAVLRHLAGPGFTHMTSARSRGALSLAAALVLALVAGTTWILSRETEQPAASPVFFGVYPPPGGSFTPTEGARQTSQLAMAPNGHALAFVAAGPDGVSRVWVRRLAALTATPLSGTEAATYPFWSPDAKSIGFFADGSLRRIDLAGGPSRTLAPAPHGRGGSWNAEGQILFAPNTVGIIHRVSADGGTAVEVTRLANNRDETSHRWPVFLPDGRRFLYYSYSTTTAHEGLYLTSLDGRDATFVANTDYGGAFLPPNRVLFLANETLMMRVLDLDRGEAVGESALVAEHVGGSSNFYGAFSVAQNGIVAYAGGAALSDLVWVDHNGQPLETISSSRQHLDFRLSPDGRVLAVTEVGAAGPADIYVLDLGRGTRARVATSGGGDASPVWAPDARRLIFRSNRDLVHDLFVKDAFDTNVEQPLVRSRAAKYPTSWSPDSQFIAFHTRDDVTRWDVAIAPTTGEATPRPLLNSTFNERQAQFSPDGRWVAYTSDESQQDEVYIQSMQNRTTRVQISVNGGDDPHWRSDGGELFYVSPDGYLVAVRLRHASAMITAEPPRRLFRFRIGREGPPYWSAYDVSPDGRRFLILVSKEDSRTQPLTVLVNPPLGAAR